MSSGETKIRGTGLHMLGHAGLGVWDSNPTLANLRMIFLGFGHPSTPLLLWSVPMTPWVYNGEFYQLGKI